MTSPSLSSSQTPTSVAWALLVCVVGCAALAWGLEAVVESPVAGPSLWSSVALKSVAEVLGGSVSFEPASQSLLVDVPYVSLLGLTSGLSIVAVIGAWCVTRNQSSNAASLANTVAAAWRWWWIGGVFVVLDALLLIAGAETLESLLLANAAHVLSLALAGWIATLLSRLMPRDGRLAGGLPWGVWVGTLAYVVVFTAMNWQLYRTLMLPHGDSAMYEEHLWNLTHGKGFRSYLDQGLFLGEHIQVVHLLLLPLYVVWPSHLLLELTQSVALAAGAMPVFWMARRASGSARIGCWVALAYLLYPPMQFLDIAIDFKTFRPEAFVIPAYLFALDQFERRRFKTAIVCLLIGLSAKEDYAIALAPFGVWLAATEFWKVRGDSVAAPDHRRMGAVGVGLAILAVAYLLFATRVAMPYFRSGNELHYVRYFSKFGESFGEVVFNMLTSPMLVLSELTSAPSIIYLLAVFVPLAFTPLWSPSRLLVAAPLLVLLCLNEVIRQDPFPRHHFQAPVIPLLFWAMTGAMARLSSRQASVLNSPHDNSASLVWRILHPAPQFMAAFACASGLLASITAGQSPLGLRFWDSGSVAYWKSNYTVTRRAELIERVLTEIPQSARVASTDFVHPRLTHYERSYDYSHYPRAVANYEDKVPDDTDYIVIDTGHRYSDIKEPRQIRELQREPKKWELLDLQTEGVFIVLRRKRP